MSRACSVLTLLLSLCVCARADTINWGSQFGSINLQSDGSTPVSAGFTIQLGTFSPGFTPNGGNVDLWAANWVVFDELLPGEHNAAFGYYTGETQLLDNTTFQPGDQAYVWMYNSQTVVPGSEWLLYTNDSTDGTNSDDWLFPSVTGGDELPLSWRVGSASRAVFGALNPDGAPSQGDGYGTAPATSFNVQTFTFVPEPAVAGFALFASLFLLGRRRRVGKQATVITSSPVVRIIPAVLAVSMVCIIGVHAQGSISGSVLADNNNDNTGDTGISGVTLTLLDSAGNPVDGDAGTPGVQAVTVLSAGNGSYSFAGLSAGIYGVRETQPAGYLSVGDSDGGNVNEILPIVVTAATESPNNNFIEEQPAAVSGFVLADLNNDNTPDTALAGVPVTLFTDPNNDGSPADGASVASVASDGIAGAYSFTGLAPGSYVVVETNALGFFDISDGDISADTPGSPVDAANSSGTDNRIPVNLAPGETDTQNNFVDEEAGEIFGTVVADTNNDNNGDTGIGGVTLTLLDSAGDPIDGNPGTPGVQAVTAITDPIGIYSFSNLRPGTYGVRETQPAGYLNVRDRDGGDPNEIRPIVLFAGGTSNGNFFVEELPATISGFVFEDVDNDNSGDAGLAGVTVTLFTDPNGDGNPADGAILGSPATTDTNGAYSFSSLPAGPYIIVETQPAGYFSVTDGDGSGDTGGSPADAANGNGTDNRLPVNVAAGETDTQNNFVDEQAGSISGSVLADDDNDDDGDTAVAGVTLTLLDTAGNPVDGDTVTPGVQPVTVLTDGTGLFTFANIQPGTWGVRETQPGGYLNVSDSDGGDPNEIRPIAVSAGASSDGHLFVDELSATVSGFVLADTNNDDAGDAGISGVTVTLFTDPDGDGDPADGAIQGAPVVTDGAGAHSFTGLPPGAYVIVETQPAGYFTVGDEDASADADGSPSDALNDSALDNRIPVHVAAGETDTENNFVDEEPGSIAGSVVADANNDDTGDAGVGDVVVILYTDPDGDGDPVDGTALPVATTDTATGAYSFTGLTPGAYVIVEVQPFGYFDVSDGDASADAGGSPVDAANSSTTDNLIPVHLAAGETDTGNDFIDELPGGISGSVLADADNDNDGDTGIEGVTLTLLDGAGDPVDGDSGTPGVQAVTTATAADGSYAFTDLSPGAYGVRETQPSLYLNVGDSDGGDSNEIRPVAVDAGIISSGNDFIEELPATVSGFVLADADNDNTGESGIGGVTITVFTDPDGDGNPVDGVAVANTPSDGGTGGYNFAGLAPGPYVIVETQPIGYFDVSDGDDSADDAGSPEDASNAGATDNFIPVHLAPDETDADNNFVEELPGSITGTVLADIDNDDDGETGIDDVTLTLVDASGNPVDGDSGTPGVQSVTAVSAANGAYTFGNLVPGTYGVVETQPAGYLDVADSDGGDPNEVRPIVVLADTSVSGNDFIEEQPAAVSGFVLADTDNDDVGDLSLAGVTLTLFTDPDGDGDPVDGVEQSTATSQPGTGEYSFTGLPPGPYVIVETQPAGYFTIGDGDVSLDSITSPSDAPNLSSLDNLIPVHVAAGETDTQNNFTDEEPGMISGSVLADGNNDDVGDEGVEGVVLTLVDVNGDPVDGDPEAPDVQPVTAVSEEGGAYSFTGVSPGVYGVLETQPDGYLDVTDNDGGDPNEIRPVTVNAGSATFGNDFVEELPAAISGFVLADTDNDNLGDSGVEGVTITLFTDPDGDGDPADGSFYADLTTAPGTGGYAFSGLPPGSYVIVESHPAGYFTVTDGDFSTDEAGSPGDAVNSTHLDNLIPVHPAAGETDSGNNFVEELPGDISGSVLADEDNDNTGDTPIPGVLLTLVNSLGNPVDGDPGTPGIQEVTTVADENGLYAFTGLLPGTYGVVETQPDGYFSETDADGGDLNEIRPILVSAGLTSTDNNFVEELPGSLSGTVWADQDNDDIGDTPLEGVELILVDEFGNPVDGDPNTPELEFLTAITDSSGLYSFEGIQPAIYGVIEFQPFGYLSARDSDGDNPDYIVSIMVLPEETSTGNDFIDELPGSLSGRVLSDDNNDGDGDTGLEGVTVMLLDSLGNPIDADEETPGLQAVSNLTAPGGDYSFTDLPPGIYGLAEIQPDGYLSVSDRDGGNPDEIRPLLVTAGMDTPANDFVDELPTGIAGFIFADINANGFHDGDETAAPPVLVQLRFDSNNDGDVDDPGEEIPVQTRAVVSGDYSFIGIPPGNYQIVVPVPPAGYGLSSPNTGETDNNEVNDDNGIQAAVGALTRSPVIGLLAGTEPGVEIDGSDMSTDSTVDFGFTFPAPVSWIAWQNLNPLDGDNAWDQNPDGDNNENLLEFAFSYDPRNGVPVNTAGLRGFRLVQNQDGGFDVEVIHPAGIIDLTYTLQYTSALEPVTLWTSNDDLAGIPPEITNLGNGFERIRWSGLDNLPELSGGRGFVRIRVDELDLELTTFTEVQGWHDRSFTTDSETVSVTFGKNEIFSGTGDTDSPQDAINVAGSATGVNMISVVAGHQALYVEVIDGPLEGHRFAVDAAACDADTIALLPGDPLNTANPVPDLSGAPFELREAWRFGELFPASTFEAGGDLNTADNIVTFDSATQTYTSYFLASLGPFGTYWVDGSDTTGPPPANQNNRVFDPGQGFYFRRRGPAVTVPAFGIVRENDFRVPLAQGFNLVGSGYPLDQSYNGRGMTLAAGFDGDTDIRRADQVLFWNGDNSPGVNGYHSTYLLDAGSPWQRWVSANDSFVTALDDEPLFKAARAAFIKRSAPFGDYTVPAPWVP